ncbi:uncharacterized protein LOC123310382 [Coccinella septempunctata]|uniref:uncharacterized protein LOC123310382 n=1 Tax=Coccinella septempunctata TaxID=41139 RepID=UPI001D076C7A|nr:uncharacterized protein LOC123310382 [Coccinella septempunctata]
MTGNNPCAKIYGGRGWKHLGKAIHERLTSPRKQQRERPLQRIYGRSSAKVTCTMNENEVRNNPEFRINITGTLQNLSNCEHGNNMARDEYRKLGRGFYLTFVLLCNGRICKG